MQKCLIDCHQISFDLVNKFVIYKYATWGINQFIAK